MEIKVLGMGCANCKKLFKNAEDAAKEAGDTTVSKVESIQEIASYGVMRTPALVIDGVVRVQGAIPSKDEILKLIKKG